jgi:hypothetical protein
VLVTGKRERRNGAGAGDVIAAFNPAWTACLVLGGYPKNSDDSPYTREKVLNTFKYKVRAQRDCDSLRRLHKFPKV